MSAPAIYHLPDLVAVASFAAAAAYLAGRSHAETAARRYHARRDQARRRHATNTTKTTRKDNY